MNGFFAHFPLEKMKDWRENGIQSKILHRKGLHQVNPGSERAAGLRCRCLGNRAARGGERVAGLAGSQPVIGPILWSDPAPIRMSERVSEDYSLGLLATTTK